MRILIIGAGVAGMTLAALLDRQGHRPRLVERAPDLDHAGYMLGLWPLGYRVLHGLGLHESFAAATIPGNHYQVRDDAGDLVRDWSMAPVNERLGPNLGCTRGQLIRLLQGGLGATDVEFETALEDLEWHPDRVRAQFTDGSRDDFDLVVGADGLHSRTRDLAFGPQPCFHTGWGGWVWFAPGDTLPAETFVEHWGVGRFVGAYPTPSGAGIFAGGPLDGTLERDGAGRAQRIRARFAGMGELVERWLADCPDDAEPAFFWRLSDVRARLWTRGRVVLLGDSAAGFLPTAGIGASMAMESAAVLADELSRTDAAGIERALALFVARRRRRVERIQQESRRLARIMFVRNPALAWLRNASTRFYSLEQFAGSLARSFDEPI